MYARASLGFLLASASIAFGQSGCSPVQLSQAARTATSIRTQLHTLTVPADDPQVPPAVATQLIQLKAALASAADAAFRCAPASAAPEHMQQVLAEALHANLGDAAESVAEVHSKDGTRDRGAFGADLAVQVFQLFGTPRIFEVDFRYGIECGDDHLLLVFQAAGEDAPDGWHEQLAWSAPRYRTVADALGDFVLLTPLTSDPVHPTWRYLVAHGQPGCGTTPRPSQFTLDLLTPSAEPARPTVSWHFEHPYTAGEATPRLATTEDTIDFRLMPNGNTEAKAGTSAAPAATMDVFRFRMNAGGQIVPMTAGMNPETPSAAASATTHSPR